MAISDKRPAHKLLSRLLRGDLPYCSKVDKQSSAKDFEFDFFILKNSLTGYSIKDLQRIIAAVVVALSACKSVKKNQLILGD